MSKIYVVGIGPGAYDQMTGRAIRALNESDVIIGYTVYVDLVKEYFAGKEFMTTPMKKEVDRCVLAFDEAKKGKTVSMICSGDAGVYGMAGLMYEVGENYPDVELTIIPGVTAATGGGFQSDSSFLHFSKRPVAARIASSITLSGFTSGSYHRWSTRSSRLFLSKAISILPTNRSPYRIGST